MKGNESKTHFSYSILAEYGQEKSYPSTYLCPGYCQWQIFGNLSYIDVKQLTGDNLIKGVNGKDWIYCRREKSQTPMKIPLLEKAKNILKKYKNPFKNSFFRSTATKKQTIIWKK